MTLNILSDGGAPPVRNILKHPVTKKEVVEAIWEAAWEQAYDKNIRCGDIRPLALRLAAEWIEKNGPEYFNDERI